MNLTSSSSSSSGGPYPLQPASCFRRLVGEARTESSKDFPREVNACLLFIGSGWVGGWVGG